MKHPDQRRKTKDEHPDQKRTCRLGAYEPGLGRFLQFSKLDTIMVLSDFLMDHRPWQEGLSNRPSVCP